MKTRDIQDANLRPSVQGRQQSAPVTVTASSSRLRVNGGGPQPVLAASASRRSAGTSGGGSVPVPTGLLPKKTVRPSPTLSPSTSPASASHIPPPLPQSFPLSSPPKSSNRASTTSATATSLTSAAVLSTEAQRILDGIRDFTLPFDLGSDSDDDREGDTGMPPPPSSERVGDTTMAPAVKVSHSMACGDDDPIPEADFREAPSTRNKPLTTSSKVTTTAGASNSAAVGRITVSSGVGGSVGGDNDSGLVGFNVNPLMRRGRDEHGHFTDVMVMEQRITLLPQFEARGGPLLQAAAHVHVPEVTTSNTPLPSKIPSTTESSSTSSMRDPNQQHHNSGNLSMDFVASVRRAAATYEPVRSAGKGGIRSSGLVNTTGIYFAHLMAQY